MSVQVPISDKDDVPLVVKDKIDDEEKYHEASWNWFCAQRVQCELVRVSMASKTGPITHHPSLRDSEY